MAPGPRKRKRTCMRMIPEAVDDAGTDTATKKKNSKTESQAQPSRPDSTQPAKNEATDDLSAQVVRPRCSQCDFPCWLCSTSDGFSPGQEDPARWRSDSEVDAKEDVMEATTIATSQNSRRTDKQKFDKLGRLLISIRDKRFTKLLERSKIRFQPHSTEMEPEEPADLSALTSPRPAVILNLNDDQLGVIGTQLYLRCLQQRNEEELQSYLAQELIRHDVIPAQEADVQYISHRRDKWKPERKGPPVAEDCDVVYDYAALEVDTAFMVSTSMFPQEMRNTLRDSDELSSWLAESNGVAPYLSFEFKSALSGEPKSTALNQITAAAAIWLFMRKELREAVSTAPISYHDIRHYGIILTADNFTVYEATTDGRYYDLKQVACGMTCKAADLRRLVRWSNAIHLWGLGPNAESFKKDMEDLVRQREKNLMALR